jgi:hypothetical protein
MTPSEIEICAKSDHPPKAVRLLRRKGYFTDADAFGANMVENRMEIVESLVRAVGYDGGPLGMLGSPDGYLVFDTDRFDTEQALELVEGI